MRALPRRAGGEAQGLVAGVPLRAMALLDAEGCVLYRTPDAERLFDLLDGPAPGRGPGSWRDGSMPDAVRCLVRSLVEAARGRAARPPRLVRRTLLGELVVEAGWLAPARAESAEGDPCRRPIAVQAVLAEHASDSAVRVLRASGATPAQTRVGVLLAMGWSKPEIARKIGVKESSVQDAARKLYARLGVRNAAELGMQLWLGQKR